MRLVPLLEDFLVLLREEPRVLLLEASPALPQVNLLALLLELEGQQAQRREGLLVPLLEPVEQQAQRLDWRWHLGRPGSAQQRATEEQLGEDCIALSALYLWFRCLEPTRVPPQSNRQEQLGSVLGHEN